MLVIVLESEVPGVSTGGLGIIKSLFFLQGELLGDVVMAFFKTGLYLEESKFHSRGRGKALIIMRKSRVIG